jgi:hypothetical protein
VEILPCSTTQHAVVVSLPSFFNETPPASRYLLG